MPDFYPIRNFLHRQLRRFENCHGRECREVTPLLPLTRKEANRLRAQRQKEIREHEREREKERREKEREKGR